MELTAEQIAILNSAGDIRINAVAGSGKTTTIIEYSRSRPANSRILYLAFNKSVKLEAAKRFAAKGIANVQVETAHSLAYKHIVRRHNYTVKTQGYTTNEIAELLQLDSTGEKHIEHIIANHISKFIAYFCNSDAAKVQQLNYLDIVTDEKARSFVNTYYTYIQQQTRVLLARMDKGEVPITHDFYLKKFQLSRPQLPYDYILFDEGQDASAVMLDIFLNQQATKVIVGDTHQQIYGWRFAVNSLEKVDFTPYSLSTSFRFRNDIARLAVEVLGWKKHIGQEVNVQIEGKGHSKQTKTKAVLARTNLGLLLRAIETIKGPKKPKHIYFEGNINSYTYADEGASLYDVLNLYNDKRSMIRDPLIKGMKDLDELEDYIEKTEDVQLGMMVEVVKEYGNEIPAIIKSIKDKHVENDEKDKAELIFSTVHRCKGMEYDSVELVNDFITEEKLENKQAQKEKEVNTTKLNEEINLLYVAITRTKNKLALPEGILPVNFPGSPDIQVVKPVTEKKPAATIVSFRERLLEKKENTKKKSYSATATKQRNTSAYKPWTEDDDDELTQQCREGRTLKEMADYFGRTKSYISTRIKKLDLGDYIGYHD